VAAFTQKGVKEEKTMRFLPDTNLRACRGKSTNPARFCRSRSGDPDHLPGVNLQGEKPDFGVRDWWILGPTGY